MFYQNDTFKYTFGISKKLRPHADTDQQLYNVAVVSFNTRKDL